MTISATGVAFYRLVEANGWQMALELMRLRNHSSHIWEWPTSLQMGEYTLAKNYFGSLAQ